MLTALETFILVSVLGGILVLFLVALVCRRPHCLFSCCCRMRYRCCHACCEREASFKDNFTWVDNSILLGGMPESRADIEYLASVQNIACIVTLQEDYEVPEGVFDADWMRLKGVVHVWRPTPDHTALPLQGIAELVSVIQLFVSQGKKVYVHCRRGQGRSATVVAAYFCERYNLSADAATVELKKRRDVVKVRTAANYGRIQEFADFRQTTDFSRLRDRTFMQYNVAAAVAPSGGEGCADSSAGAAAAAAAAR